MEYHKSMMKASLAENLRVLMGRKMFDKITIKQICDETGVIRATFYNYFEDKYDCLNWIVYMDLVQIASQNHHLDSAGLLDLALRNVEENLAFYRNAYLVTGQNSFEDMIRSNLAKLLLGYFEQNRNPSTLPQYPNELLARYYAESVAFVIRQFVHESNRHTVEETRKMALDLLGHSLMSFA